jgi:hypothetical protein
MTLWKTEHYRNLPSEQGSERFLDLAALVGIAALPGLLFVWLMPLPFVPPLIAVVSFLIAGLFGWFAHRSKADPRAAGLTAWDVAGVFTVLWVGAAFASDHHHLVRLIEILAQAS